MQNKKTVDFIKKSKPVQNFNENKVLITPNFFSLELSDDDDRDEYGNPTKFIGDDFIEL